MRSRLSSKSLNAGISHSSASIEFPLRIGSTLCQERKTRAHSKSWTSTADRRRTMSTNANDWILIYRTDQLLQRSDKKKFVRKTAQRAVRLSSGQNMMATSATFPRLDFWPAKEIGGTQFRAPYRTGRSRDEINTWNQWQQIPSWYRKLAGRFSPIFQTIGFRDKTNDSLIETTAG